MRQRFQAHGADDTQMSACLRSDADVSHLRGHGCGWVTGRQCSEPPSPPSLLLKLGPGGQTKYHVLVTKCLI